ncbi:hypothetical protein JTB14_020783 [Gonioctena quinquepunctata]|nr:hypothetical protein JTB14_020783 [Gonioctena quinquepunctata]
MESFDDVDWRPWIAVECMKGQKRDIAESSAMDSCRGTVVCVVESMEEHKSAAVENSHLKIYNLVVSELLNRRKNALKKLHMTVLLVSCLDRFKHP